MKTQPKAVSVYPTPMRHLIAIVVSLAVLYWCTINKGSSYALLVVWFLFGAAHYFIYCEKYDFYEDRMVIRSIWRPMSIDYKNILKVEKFHMSYTHMIYIKNNQRIRLFSRGLYSKSTVTHALSLVSNSLVSGKTRLTYP